MQLSVFDGLRPLFVAMAIVTVSGCAISGTIVETPPAPGSMLSGTVVDVDGEAVVDAMVFLDRSSYSTRTDGQGRFEFAALPTAYYRVVAVGEDSHPSVVGIALRQGETASVVMELEPARSTVPEGSNGRAETASESLQRLISGGISECRIVNPDVLTVVESRRRTVSQHTLKAHGPVELENEFTGYRMVVYLDQMDVFSQGNEYSFRTDMLVRFEPLKPSSGMQAERWEENRRQVYLGSFQHFLRSLAARNLRTDGFAVSRPFQSTHAAPGISGLQETVATWTMARDEQIVSGRPNAYLQHLNVPSTIRVAHRGAAITPDAGRYVGGVEADDRPTSRVSLSQGLLAFTRDGLPADETGILTEGVWGAPRLCHQLPIDLFVTVE